MIQTYFGNGKGKTTSAIGSAIRCVGCGKRVLFVQFLKNNDSSEYRLMEKTENIDILFSNEYYRLYDNLNDECTSVLREAYSKLLFEDTKKSLDSYSMIILDEILDAVEFGYVDEEEFLSLLRENKDRAEIILTGHSITDKIAEISDYLSEIREIKHPYSYGTEPRKGIEF